MTGKTSILIVDDDEGTRKTLTMILDKKGYETETAATGQAAVEKARARAFDLAFLDIRLPDVGGVDLIAALKETQPHLAVIMVTGYASVGTAVQALSAGASGYVAKPVNVEELLAVARAALEQQQLAKEKQRAEEALRESTAQLVKAQQLAHMGFLDWDLDTDDIELSQQVIEMYGLDPAGKWVTPSFVAQVCHPDDLDFVRKNLEQAVKGEKPFDIDHRVVRSDGAVLWVHAQGELEWDEQGQPVRLLGTVVDITERVRAEAALKESERKYRLLTEISPAGIFCTNARGRTTYVNDRWCEISGLAADQALGDGWLRAVHPNDRERLIAGWQEAVERNAPATVEYRFLRPDGTVAWVMGQAAPEVNEQGRVVGYVGAITDITELKQTGRALQESEQRFRLLAESALSGIYLIQEGRFRYINQALASIFGYRVEELIDRLGPLDLTHPDDRPRVAENIRRRVEGEVRDLRYEFRGQRKDGTLIHLEVHGRRLEHGGQVSIIGTLVDVTDRVQAEQALRRQAEETAALLDVSQALNRLDLETILHTIGERAKALFAADGSRLFLLEPDGETSSAVEPTLRCVLALHQRAEKVLGIRIKLGQGVTGSVAARGEPEIVNDSLGDPRAMQVPGTPVEQEVMMFAPLQERGRLLGVLSVSRLGNERPFQPADLELLKALAAMASTAIHNAQLFEQARQRLQELTSLHQTALDIAAQLEMADVLNAIITRASDLVGASGGLIHLYEPDRDRLVAVTSYRLERDYTGLTLEVGEGVAGRVFQSREPLVVADHRIWAGKSPQVTDSQARAMLSVPLRWGNEIIGVLDVIDNERAGVFGEGDVRLLEPLATQAAIAIQNARLYDEARRRNRELTLLNRVIAATAAGEALEPVLEIVCRELALAFEVPQAAAALFNKEKTEAVVVAEYLAPGRPPSLGEHIPVADNPGSQHLLTHKTPLSIGDAQTDPRLAPIHDLMSRRGTVSLLLLPLVVDGEVVGSLGVDAIEPRPFSAAEVNLAWRVAEQVSGVLARTQLWEERQQLEAQFHQAQKMEAVGRLAGGVAHDFNNLLTVIELSARLLERKLLPQDPFRTHVQRIQDASRSAANLTKQLLVFSRREVVQPQVLNLNQVLGDVDRMLQRLIGEDIELTTRLGDDLWLVQIDPTQVEQVVVNLAVNARDAMPTGGKLALETANVVLDETYAAHHLEVKPGEYAMVAVSDDGVGMSDEVKAHLFEPFFTTKERGKGTGLGLATVFGIVKQNGGHIGVYSEVGQGTTFKVYLPRVVEGAPIPAPHPKAVAARGTETLLLVEDEPQVRELTRDILRAQGYQVLTASDGLEALQVAAAYEEPIHLLVTDVVMPRMSGRALADQLQISRPETRVLFTSGYTDDAIVHHGVLTEGVAFLSKPFKLEALARKVRDVLDAGV